MQYFRICILALCERKITVRTTKMTSILTAFGIKYLPKRSAHLHDSLLFKYLKLISSPYSCRTVLQRINLFLNIDDNSRK